MPRDPEMSSINEILSLKENRDRIFASATKHLEHARNLTKDNFHKFRVRYDKITSLEESFENLQQRIIIVNTQLSDPNNALEVNNVQVAFEDVIMEAKSIFLDFQRKYPVETSAPKTGTSVVIPSKSLLPTINIPKFTGKVEHWAEFFDLFTSLIHNDATLTTVQKFHYLKSSLEREPLAVISCFQLTAENYGLALESLKERYQSKKRLATLYLNQIMKFAPINNSSLANLQHYITVHKSSINALSALNLPDMSEFILFHIAYRNLDPHSRMAYEKQANLNSIPTYKDLMCFVTNRTKQAESMADMGLSDKQPPIRKVNSFLNNFPGSMTPSYSCVYCAGTHKLGSCSKFINIPLQEKYEFLKGNHRCFNCLGNHMKSKCNSKGTCKTCNKTHHSLLHRDDVPVSKAVTLDTVNPASKQEVTNSLSCRSAPVKVLLSTVKVAIKDSSGNSQIVRAVLDSGSQISMITLSAVNRLGLRFSKTPMPLFGVSNTQTTTLGLLNCFISSRNDSKTILSTNAIVVSEICNNLPHECLPAEVVDRFKHLDLADDSFFEPSPIELLIGNDLYPLIIDTNPHSLIKGNPCAQRTTFGWIITGRISPQIEHSATSSLLSVAPSLDSLICKFWEIEEVTNHPRIPNPDDILVEEHFVATHRRDTSGRYVVELPFKILAPPLTNNRDMAMKCFLNLESRLNKNPKVKLEYDKFLAEYLSLGHMELAKVPSNYILPHHCVFKQLSTSTKLRVVFNASAEDPKGNSLNKTLHNGPKVQRELSSILLSFRFHKIAICCDIKMMYRQILIKEEQRHFQHIFYRQTPTMEVQEFQLNTVTYGETPASFLAQRTLLQLKEDEGSNYPLAAKALVSDTYMDDICSGADSLIEAKELTSQLVDLLQKGGFELRKWSSNNPLALSAFPVDFLETPILLYSDESAIKVLGLMWEPTSDCFKYYITPFTGPVTKRTVLSYMSRIFDPLGYLSPIIFNIKSFLQKLWTSNTVWDEVLPSDLLNYWIEFSQGLPCLSELSIPRYTSSCVDDHHLVGFCDASAKGYSAVVYLRSVGADNKVKISLLRAKSRVAPLKTLSIPRLELCGALLLSRVMKSVIEDLPNLNPLNINLFSDASVVIAWINKSPHLMKTFVANRVTEITQLFPPTHWSHVSTNLNPADISTRDCAPLDFLANTLWWQGPNFLTQPPSEWPSTIPLVDDETPELKPLKSLVTVAKDTPHFIQMFENFSSWTRLTRVMAYMLRFINNSGLKEENKENALCGPLSVKELQKSTNLILSITQHHYFPFIFNSKLKSPNSITALSPYVDNVGLIRVGGRLKHSGLSDSAKHPLLLPKNCHLAVLICDYFHKISLHSGPRTTQGLIQRQYWILSVRNLVRKRVHACLTCHKFRAPVIQPLMADLPQARVTVSRPFGSTGVDFAGPFPTKETNRRNARISKSYLCLFVCFSTKAVHLEAVSSLSTPAFIATFERFIARRGLPNDIHSDCGRNFVGFSHHLRDLYKSLKGSAEDIGSHLANRGVNWHFNPPYSPHFGGLHEAGIKSAKLLLHRMLSRNSALSFEEYSTLFARVEAVLNSRPLCLTTPHPQDDPDLLTPGHFLVGGPLLSVAEPLTDGNLSYVDRWTKVKILLQTFWKRWSSEYLHTLMQKGKWTKVQNNLNIGDVVFLKDTSSSPLCWPVGRITEVHPGSDGMVRVVTVRTAHGSYIRPVVKLLCLPS